MGSFDPCHFVFLLVLGLAAFATKGGINVRKFNYFKCRNHEVVHISERCNGVKDCRDESDEIDCSRYPDVKKPLPADYDSQAWKKSFWPRFLDSNSNFHVNEWKKTAIDAYSEITIGRCNIYRRITANGLEARSCFQLGYYSKHESLNDHNLQVLAQGEEEDLEWIKGTQGHVPKGAVIFRLNAVYEISFVCKMQYNIANSSFIFSRTFVGELSLKQRVCSLGDISVPDYKVLRDVQLISSRDDSCENGAFPCGDGLCIPKENVCDGENDCLNGGDEEINWCRKKYNCSHLEFPCSPGECIPLSLTCEGNGLHQCIGGKDESVDTCGRSACDPFGFKCKVGGCVYEIQVCDGQNNCEDGSDESICGGNCNNTEFACTNGRCIPTTWHCDDQIDCSDGSDEKFCGNNACSEAICNRRPHMFENRWWNKGMWVTQDSGNENHYFFIRSSLIEATLSGEHICRILDTTNTSSRHYVGELSHKRFMVEDYVCNPSTGGIRSRNTSQAGSVEILQNYPGTGGYTWEGSKDGDLVEGSTIGGLTEEYQIFFVCIKYYKTRNVLGHMLPRTGICITRKSLPDRSNSYHLLTFPK